MFTDHSIKNFWKNVNKKGEDECWSWRKGHDKDGYGRAWFQFTGTEKRIGVRVHRFMLMIQNNSLIPNGLVVMHSCDNPGCCNPAHLSIGTVLSNNMDKINKGRTNSAKGIRNARSKLTEDQVRDIKSRVIVGKRSGYGQPTNIKDLAEEFNVHPELIRMIAHGRIWKHIV